MNARKALLDMEKVTDSIGDKFNNIIEEELKYQLEQGQFTRLPREDYLVKIRNSVENMLIIAYLQGRFSINKRVFPKKKFRESENHENPTVTALQEALGLDDSYIYQISDSIADKVEVVAQLSYYDLANKMNVIMDKNLREGETSREFYKRWGQDESLKNLKGDFELLGKDKVLRKMNWKNYADVVFRTNTASAFAAGREKEIQSLKEYIAFKEYVAIDDNRITEICASRNNLVARVDDPVWSSVFAPCHFRCRSIIAVVTKVEAEALGIKQSPASKFEGVGAFKKSKSEKVFSHPAKSWNVPSKEMLDRLPVKVKKSLEKGQRNSILPISDKDREAITVAQMFITDKLGINVNYSELSNIAIVKEINKALVELKNEGLMYFDSITSTYDTSKEYANSPFQNRVEYYSKTAEMKNILAINDGCLSRYPSLRDFKSVIKLNNRVDWWTSKSVKDLLLHEVGHARTYQQGKNFKQIKQFIHKKHNYTYISGYGNFDIGEYIAEAYVMYVNGHEIPDDALKLFKKFKITIED